MTSQLMLVIVIVAAGIVLAAVVALRAGKISANVGRAGAAPGDAAPPYPQTEAAKSDTPGAEQRGESAPTNLASDPNAVSHASTNAPVSTVPAASASALTDADTTASPNSPTKPAATATLSDTSDLVFSLVPAVADNATRATTAPAATPTHPAAAAPSTPITRAALVAGSTPPESPQVLQPAEIFTKLFDLALGKTRPASSVTAGHHDVAAATGAALKDAATQQRYSPRRPNMLRKIRRWSAVY
jgi:hypothetical protein